jgi:AraC family transcriptional regulator
MEDARPIWILSGRFGRATVNVTDKALVEHAHREFNILFKLGGADTAFRSENQSLALDDNSLLLFNPWVPHAKLANADAPTMVLSLIIEPEWLVRVLADRAPRIDRLFPNSRETITEEIRIHANRLGAAIPHQLMAGGGDCEDLLVDLVDSVTRIRKALAYIHEHALENPMIDDVARQVGLSRSRFFEQFRKCVGASPQHYIDWVRMTAATRWLANTDRPLIELADELGFGAHSNFTRFFTQHIAVSPSDFRRRTISVETEPQDRRPKLVASR